MSLRDLQLKRRYRSSDDSLLSSFYVPCLSEATDYRRAVGYFSAATLGLAARGLSVFIKSGGHMRLVASPDLTGVDPEIVGEAYEKRDRVLGETMSGTLVAGASSGQTRQRLGLLGWLVAKGRLDLKIAVVDRDDQQGIYHEKLGIFTDAEGNRVAFHGSANESRGALVVNFESVMVFRSWMPHESEDVDAFVEEFDALWEDRTPGLRVFDFPQAARLELIDMAPEEPPQEEPAAPPTETREGEARVAGLRKHALPEIPAGLDLRSYQREALRSWFGSEGRGVLEMATGTGKTVTALAAVEQLSRAAQEREGSLFALVVCPYQHLVTQWASARRYRRKPAGSLEALIARRDRSDRPREMALTDRTQAGPEEWACDAETRREVYGAIATLPEGQRAVIVPYALGWSSHEIAAGLGRSHRSVRKGIWRGKRTLGTRLRP